MINYFKNPPNNEDF